MKMELKQTGFPIVEGIPWKSNEIEERLSAAMMHIDSILLRTDAWDFSPSHSEGRDLGEIEAEWEEVEGLLDSELATVEGAVVDLSQLTASIVDRAGLLGLHSDKHTTPPTFHGNQHPPSPSRIPGSPSRLWQQPQPPAMFAPGSPMGPPPVCPGHMAPPPLIAPMVILPEPVQPEIAASLTEYWTGMAQRAARVASEVLGGESHALEESLHVHMRHVDRVIGDELQEALLGQEAVLGGHLYAAATSNPQMNPLMRQVIDVVRAEVERAMGSEVERSQRAALALRRAGPKGRSSREEQLAMRMAEELDTRLAEQKKSNEEAAAHAERMRDIEDRAAERSAAEARYKELQVILPNPNPNWRLDTRSFR